MLKFSLLSRARKESTSQGEREKKKSKKRTDTSVQQGEKGGKSKVWIAVRGVNFLDYII